MNKPTPKKYTDFELGMLMAFAAIIGLLIGILWSPLQVAAEHFFLG